MKHLLVAISVVFTMAACKNEKSDSRNIELLADSTAYNNNMYSDTSSMYQTEEQLQPAVPVKSVTTRTSSTTTAPRSRTTTSSGSASTSNQGTQTTQTTPEKKGWSSAAKGAVIGAGAGAIGGAVISKKKPVQGAVIGGAVGAAGGYIIGKDIDKRKGR